MAKSRHAACFEHRGQAQALSGLTEKQQAGLSKGRVKGTNNLTGIPKSEESNIKRSEAMRRWAKENPDAVKARAEVHRGENHRLWKGGVSQLNQAIRRTTENRKWMAAVVARDGLCRKCGSQDNLEAHHIIGLADLISLHGIQSVDVAKGTPELWDLNNGETLCGPCHHSHHGRLYTSTGDGRRQQPRKQRRSMRGENNPNYRGGDVQLGCPQCGASFFVKPSLASRRKFCSRECVNENKRKAI